MRRINFALVLGLSILMVLVMSTFVGAEGHNGCWGLCCDLGDDAEIVQYGVSNDASIHQTGVREGNIPWTPSFDPCLPIGCAKGGNFAEIFQMGYMNKASISQMGALNYASIFSYGEANNVTITQNGKHLSTFIGQAGYLNTAVLNQSGTLNHAMVDQCGYNNFASVTQTAVKDSASVMQMGFLNTASVVQN